MKFLSHWRREINITACLISYDFSHIYVCRYDKGAHLYLPSYVMRTHGAKQQRDTIKRTPAKQLKQVFEVCGVKYFLLHIGRKQVVLILHV